MSRMKRRAGRGSARSRRTPARPATGGGPRIPTLPLFIVAGIAIVGGLIAYLIWQQSQPAGSSFGEAAEIEADPAEELPGEFIDLQAIYGGEYGSIEGENTARHVQREVDYSEQGLPPAGGPHWGNSVCPSDPDEATPFCGPAPWGIYRKPWETATLVHNLEHAGVVIWYNTTDQSVIDELEGLIADRLNDGQLLVMAPYPEMEEEHIAVTAWGRRDDFPISEYSNDRVEEFIDVFDRRFNPEGF